MEIFDGKKMAFWPMFGLQFFADGGEEGDTGDNGGENGEGEKKQPEGRTYTDAEVDRIVAKHKAKWEKQLAKRIELAQEEVRRYERMSKEQREEADRKKAEEESAKKDAEIAELQRQLDVEQLRKTVVADVEAMPDGIVATQDFLDLVVTGDADTTNANVNKLVGLIRDVRKAQEEKRATGRTPKSYGGNDGNWTEIQKRIAKYTTK